MASTSRVIWLLACFIVLVKLNECDGAKFAYKSNLTLDCSILDGEVEFYREKENKTDEAGPILFLDSKDKVIIENKTLTVLNLMGEDFKDYSFYCVSKRNSSIRHEFVKQIAPYLYKPEKQSITITEGGSVDFSCKLLFGLDKSVQWEWYKKDTTEPLTNQTDPQRIIVESHSDHSKLTIKKVIQTDRSVYYCKVKSDFGEHQEEVMLRVKDTLAALWPFLAIVAEVIVLCLVILIYEKKCAKKNNSNDEDNEQTQNLMGKDGQNPDVKKRTAKA